MGPDSSQRRLADLHERAAPVRRARLVRRRWNVGCCARRPSGAWTTPFAVGAGGCHVWRLLECAVRAYAQLSGPDVDSTRAVRVCGGFHRCKHGDREARIVNRLLPWLLLIVA